jgi:hypothetical protein
MWPAASWEGVDADGNRVPTLVMVGDRTCLFIFLDEGIDVATFVSSLGLLLGKP